MTRAFLIVYSGRAGSATDVEAWADSCPLVSHWRYDLPQCVYVLSAATPDELARNFAAATGGRGGFLVSEVTDQSSGLLPAETWHMLRFKEPLSAAGGRAAREPAPAVAAP